MDRKEIIKKEGAMYCTEKDIWCVHTDLQTGGCNKNAPCDVRTEAWKKREAEKEAEKQRRRSEALARKNEELPRVTVRIPDNRRLKETQQHTLTTLIQDKEIQMARAYKTGKTWTGDRIAKEILELKKQMKGERV